jgi:mono/diheme cytochrome c family protein
VVLTDRYGSTLGPFFKKGHQMQSGASSATLTAGQTVDLMHFLRQRINDTLRGSAVFTVQDILTGNAKAGEVYFNGEGGCAACHSASGDLAGLASRIPAPVDVQQRMLFPLRRAGRSEVTVTITQAGGTALKGVWVTEDDFFVTMRESSGTMRVVRKTPDVTMTTIEPLAAHRELLDRITDKQIHDVVAYLVTLR